MGFDKTSNDPSVQYQPSPRVTPKETSVESPKETSKYSSGAPKNNSMTRGEADAGRKIRRIRLRQVRISVEVLEDGGARQGAQREIEIPYAVDSDELIERALTAAADEIKLKLKG